MDPTNGLDELERRYRRIYEVSRLRRAISSFLPVLFLIATAIYFGGSAATALVAGPLLFVSGVLALWYGRDPGRGVLPGVLAGGGALVLVLCANQMGHFCTGERCMSWCLPACIVGGLLAGSGVSLIGVRERRGAGYWGSATLVTLATGALGCSCVGFSGIIGLAVGFVLVTWSSAGLSSLRARS